MMHTIYLNFKNVNYIPYYLIILSLLIYLTIKIYQNINIEKKKKKLFIILRITVWSILILLLIEPLITLHISKKLKSNFYILFDNSLSMQIKDKNNLSRIEKSKSILNTSFYKYLKKYFNLQNLIFSSKIEFINNNIKKYLTGTGESSDIPYALNSIILQHNESDNSGIILISDGNSTSYFPISRIINIYKKLKIPIFTINLFQNEEIKDLSILDVNYPEEVGINSKFFVKLKINSLNYKKIINGYLEILINDKLYKKETIKIKNGINFHKINLILTKKGINRIKIKLISNKKEATLLNNYKIFFIRGIKNKFKILLLYGKPGWEYKFLKECLEQDANIKLTPYVKLKKDSLTPLNSIYIRKYDLIIIGNIKYKDIPSKFINKIVNNIKIYPISLLFLGGENAFKNGGYQNSKFKNIIPVNWNYAGSIYIENFNLQLTPIGETSPIFNINNNKNIWEKLPPFDKINIVKKVKNNAKILALSSKNKEFIVLAISKYNRSNIGIFTATPTWPWYFLNSGLNQDTSLYFNFWRQLIRNMVMNEFKQINLSTDKLSYQKDETIKIRLLLYNKNLHPLNASFQIIKIFKKLNGNYKFLKDIKLYQNDITKGLYETSIKLNEYGEYKLTIKSPSLKKRASTYFIIKKPEIELTKLAADIPLLKKIAKDSNGMYLSLNELNKIKDKLKVKNKKVNIKEEISLWNNWIILLILISLLSIEWWLRKKEGLS